VPTAGAGDQVAVGPNVAQPQAPSVARFVTKYFAAINQLDYPAYQRLYEPGTQPVTSEPAFSADYRTTTDSSEVLVGLSRTATGGWDASVTFRSHQSVADSASHSACTDWSVSFFLVTPSRPYLFGHYPPGYHATFHACP
jgi:hypothetical protein